MIDPQPYATEATDNLPLDLMSQPIGTINMDLYDLVVPHTIGVAWNAIWVALFVATDEALWDGTSLALAMGLIG